MSFWGRPPRRRGARARRATHGRLVGEVEQLAVPDPRARSPPGRPRRGRASRPRGGSPACCGSSRSARTANPSGSSKLLAVDVLVVVHEQPDRRRSPRLRACSSAPSASASRGPAPRRRRARRTADRAPRRRRSARRAARRRSRTAEPRRAGNRSSTLALRARWTHRSGTSRTRCRCPSSARRRCCCSARLKQTNSTRRSSRERQRRACSSASIVFPEPAHPVDPHPLGSCRRASSAACSEVSRRSSSCSSRKLLPAGRGARRRRASRSRSIAAPSPGGLRFSRAPPWYARTRSIAGSSRPGTSPRSIRISRGPSGAIAASTVVSGNATACTSSRSLPRQPSTCVDQPGGCGGDRAPA